MWRPKRTGQRNIVSRDGTTVTLSCGHTIERRQSAVFKTAMCTLCIESGRPPRGRKRATPFTSVDSVKP